LRGGKGKKKTPRIKGLICHRGIGKTLGTEQQGVRMEGRVQAGGWLMAERKIIAQRGLQGNKQKG